MFNINKTISICSSNDDFDYSNSFTDFLHMEYMKTSLKDKKYFIINCKNGKKDYKQRINLDDALLETQRIKSSCGR